MKNFKLWMVVGFVGILGFTVSGYNVKAEIDTQSQSTVVEKEFTDLSPDEQKYFQDKGFGEEDEYYTEYVVQELPSASDDIVNIRAANVLALTASTKRISNTQGRTEYILTSSNSPVTRINMQLSLGNVRNYTQTVNVYSAYAYGGGMYFTYTGPRGYRGVRLTARVYNGFGAGSVSCGAGGLTIGR